MKCAIRDCAETHTLQIDAIYRHHVPHGSASFAEAPPSADDLMPRRAAVIAAGLPYPVAEADRRIVGYAYASPYRSRSAYRFTIADSVDVDHGLGGDGFGRGLLSRLVARCETGDWRQLVAVIGDSGNPLRSRCTSAAGSCIRGCCAPWDSSSGAGSTPS